MEKKMTIAQAKRLLEEDPTPELLETFRKDGRKGIQKKLQKQAEFENRLKLERAYWNFGIENVGGIDEVGRGPLAGPVIACCVILPHDFDLIDVNDSKQLTAEKREKL